MTGDFAQPPARPDRRREKSLARPRGDRGRRGRREEHGGNWGSGGYGTGNRTERADRDDDADGGPRVNIGSWGEDPDAEGATSTRRAC
jgi:hypothetical protein